jgi:metal-responsive CopG/Arc/MetJ family transcriptional regulator
MRRYNFFFPEDLIEELKELSKKTGAPMSELLRRSLKEYLDNIKKDNTNDKR